MNAPPMTSAAARPIGMLDLAAEREQIGPEIEAAVLDVLRSGRYVLGPAVERFEKSFAALCGVEHGIGVSSGTDALVLALLAVGVRPGDHVVTSPFTFFASAGTIAWVGAVPRLADIDPATGLLDPTAAAAAVDARTTCLLPVHLYGQLADVRAFRSLADARHLSIVEDGAQAHGASRDGARVGELADAGILSFYPTKNLGAAGEAGLVVTRRAEVAARLRELRDHGMAAKYTHVRLGTNARMDALQGAVLGVKLPHLAVWNARRREIAARYDAAFAGTAVRPLAAAPGSHHVYHQYAVRIPDEGVRDAVLAGLARAGIQAAVHYPRPVHLQAAAAGWGYGPGDFPAAETLAAEVLCLPIHPFLADLDADRVAEAVRELAGS
ncbi:MAG: DegT/DnrJ/EryC1/StrS family aminotransferase [Planctomycetota bacterium]